MKIKDLKLEKLFSTYYNWILGKAALFPIDVVVLLEVSVKILLVIIHDYWSHHWYSSMPNWRSHTWLETMIFIVVEAIEHLRIISKSWNFLTILETGKWKYSYMKPMLIISAWFTLGHHLQFRAFSDDLTGCFLFL